MKIAAICMLVILFETNAYGATKSDAVKVVKDYSKTVACQVSNNEYKNQFKAIEIDPGDQDHEGFHSQHLVFWEGDFGCNGGNGTVVPNFTFVEHSGFISAKPVVKSNLKFPDLDLLIVTKFEGKNREVYIEGLTYGPDDIQHNPTKNVSYHIKFDKGMFILK